MRRPHRRQYVRADSAVLSTAAAEPAVPALGSGDEDGAMAEDSPDVARSRAAAKIAAIEEDEEDEEEEPAVVGVDGA